MQSTNCWAVATSLHDEPDMPLEQRSSITEDTSGRPKSLHSLNLKELRTAEARAVAVAIEGNRDSTGSMMALKRLQTVADSSYKQRLVKKFLHAPAFEYSMATVILSNIAVMIVELDRSAMEISSSTTHWTEIFGWVVLVLFTVELILRLIVYRWSFWRDAWNVFDFIIVATDLLASIIALVAEGVFPVTVLRIFRLAKLARASKVLRIFPELRTLLASLMSSIGVIFWGAVLLCLVLLVWSMVAVLFIHPLNKDIFYGDCERCPRAYSTVMQSALTLWQQIVVGDEWGQITIPIIEEHPATVLFFLPLFLSLGMAVVNLILGMVVSVAQQAKTELKAMDDAQARAVKLESHSNLLKLCRQMDQNKSGELTYEELKANFEKPGAFRDSMESLSISQDDFNVVWAMMDPDNTGSVSYKRLVSRLYRIQTSNSEFTLAYLKYHTTVVKNLLAQMHVEQAEINRRLVEDLGRVESKEDTVLKRQGTFLERLQAVENHAPDRESRIQAEKERTVQAINGISIGQEASEATKGDDPQIQLLLERLLPALEKEYKAVKKEEKAVAEVSQVVWQIQESAKKILEGMGQRSSKSLADIQSERAASMNDETHIWFKKVCGDIQQMRLELNTKLMNMERKLGSTAPPLSASGTPSATERDTLTTEAQLSLLVVPKKAASCNLFRKGCCDAAEEQGRRIITGS